MPFHGDDKEKDGVGCTGLYGLAYCGDLCALEDNEDLCTLRDNDVLCALTDNDDGKTRLDSLLWV